MTTTSVSSSVEVPSLTFPRATFAKLSPHPYLLAHLQSPSRLRPNGRKTSTFRDPNINTSSLSHAHGSAVVRTGDTTAVCGVRGEILLANETNTFRSGHELRDLDLLVPNIELATGCSPEFLPGQPPSMLAQSLSTRLFSLLHSSRLVDADSLKIWHEAENEEGDIERVVKAYWTLYVDVLFISLDGNPFDVAWASVLAALQDTRLPYAYWDVDREMILCSDEASQSKTLGLNGSPIACSYAISTTKDNARKQGEERTYWILSDPDAFEEGLCDEKVTMTVDCSNNAQRILGISKSGGVSIGREEMAHIATMSNKRWEEYSDALSKSKKA